MVVTLHTFREGHLPKTSVESTSLPQKEKSPSHSRQIQHTLTGTEFSSLCFSENYHLAVLRKQKDLLTSDTVKLSLCQKSVRYEELQLYPCLPENVLPEWTLFNTALHSLITEGNLQSPFNSRSLTICEPNNGNSSYICSACLRPEPKPLYHTITATILPYSRVRFFSLLMFREK